jgi:hypothetical protein
LVRNLQGVDPYRELAVHPTADAEAIIAAHRRLVKKLHPDVAGTDGERVKILNLCRDVLLDPASRAAYDLSVQPVGARMAQPPGPGSEPPGPTATAPASTSTPTSSNAAPAPRRRSRRWVGLVVVVVVLTAGVLAAAGVLNLGAAAPPASPTTSPTADLAARHHDAAVAEEKVIVRMMATWAKADPLLQAVQTNCHEQATLTGLTSAGQEFDAERTDATAIRNRYNDLFNLLPYDPTDGYPGSSEHQVLDDLDVVLSVSATQTAGTASYLATEPTGDCGSLLGGSISPLAGQGAGVLSDYLRRLAESWNPVARQYALAPIHIS